MEKDDPSDKTRDFLLMGPETPEGTTAIRSREGQIEIGVLQDMKDGQPMSSSTEILSLERAGCDGVYEIKDSYRAGSSSTASKAGPALVNSKQFMDGWDKAFGAKDKNQFN